ncbi:hypothetical protein [Amycolatopsis sp. cmx-8-4]
MATQSPSAADTVPSIDELIDRAGDLKGELIAFSQSPSSGRT